MTVPVLTGDRVRLRPPVQSDAALRQALGSDPEIHRMFGGSRADLAPYSASRAEHWIEGLLAHPHAWIIEVGQRMIGEIRLDRLDATDRRATLAVGIYASDALSLGYGTEAAQLLLAHAFGPLGLHRVGLRVLSYNARAIRSYTKCGFVIEGRERESALVDDEWHDDIIMGILAADFRGRTS